MNLFTISFILSFISLFSIAILCFAKIKKKSISENYGWSFLMAALWAFAGFKFSSTQSKDLALFWMKIAHISVIFTPVFFFDFVSKYTKNYNKKLIVTVYALGFIFLGFSLFYDNFFSVVFAFNQFYFFRSYLGNNLIYSIFYVLFYWVLLIYAFFLLFRLFRRTTGAQHNQIKYFIFGMILGWLGPEGMFLLVFGIPIYPFSNFLVAIFPYVFTYAILRHQLLDIKIVIKKSLVYSTLIALVTAMYLLFVIFIEKTFQNLIGYNSYIVNIVAVFLIAIIFEPLRNLIQSLFDRLFFKGTLYTLSKEKQYLEEELRRSDRLKAVATLAAGMAHEIKNPLTGIKTFTEYLDKNKDNPEFIEKFKKIVGSEVDRINGIVHQLLDFAKPTPLTLKECDIQQILDETLSLLSSDLLKHNIILEKEFGAENAKIMADFNQLKQAFLNIFLNSIQAMPNGGSLKIGTLITLDKLRIIIEDSGVGIFEKDLQHIFDPFYTTTDEGTGLGLSITHGIIKEHNGRIDVESKVEVGTKFVISFPLVTQ